MHLVSLYQYLSGQFDAAAAFALFLASDMHLKRCNLTLELGSGCSTVVKRTHSDQEVYEFKSCQVPGFLLPLPFLSTVECP